MRRPLALVAAAAIVLGFTTGTSVAHQEPSQASPALAVPRAPTGDADTTDPSARGPYATVRKDVIRGWARVDIGYPAGVLGDGVPLVEDVSEITYPVDGYGDVAPGRHPVVILLHGMHAWCSDEGPVVKPVPWWCEGTGDRPVPSYQGYRYIANVLASQGRIVVSISASGLNAVDAIGSFAGLADLGMQARGKLVLHHLRKLAAADQRRVKGLGTRFVGHLDLDRSVLVGHSRGGEGVVVAAQMLERMADAPARVSGVVNLAPTAFSQSAPANTPTMTLLPACDGDVYDLQGQTYVDRGRDLYGGNGYLRTSVWFAGGNHNFLNTEWTPGLSLSGTGSDDAERTYKDVRTSGSCRPQHRLSPAEERTVGLAYTAALVRLTQDDNSAMLPILDGTGIVPQTVMQQQTQTRASGLAGPDRLLAVPEPDSEVSAKGTTTQLCQGSQLPGKEKTFSSFCAYRSVTPGYDTSWLGPGGGLPLPGRTAVRIRWERPGSGWLDLDSVTDLSSSSRVSMRVVIDPATSGSVRMMVRDASGATATVATQGQALMPLTRGAEANRLVPQTAWVNVADLRGIDITRVTAVGLATSGSGGAWILDVSHRTRQAAPRAQLLPLSSVVPAQERVPAGTSTVAVRVEFDRPALPGARLAIKVFLDEVIKPVGPSGVIDVPAGATYVEIPIQVTMPDVVGPDEQYSGGLLAYPMHGLTAGSNASYVSVIPEGVTIRTIDVIDPIVEANPGGRFAWDFSSSDGASVTVALEMVGADMDYADLDAAFREDRGLPAQGPIASGESLELYTDEVSPGVFRAVLPLSKSASRGAWITYRIQSVSGALVPEDAPFLTGTVGIGESIARGLDLIRR